MKKLSFLLLSVFLASCGQEVVPIGTSSVSPIKTEVPAPIVEKEVAPIVKSNSWVTEQSLTWAVSSSWSTNEVSFSDAQIQDILAKIESYMNSLNARANTGSLIVGDYSAQYNQSQSWDTIDVNINGVKSTIEGIRTKKDVVWPKRCHELGEKLNCFQNNISKSKQFKDCLTIKLDWKICLWKYPEMNFDVDKLVVFEDNFSNYSNVYWELLDFSPSGNFILIKVGTGGVSADNLLNLASVLINTKTWEKILSYPTGYYTDSIFYQGWTPNKSQFIYISKDREGKILLNVTKKDNFPKLDQIELDSEINWGLNDEKYVYLLSEKDSIKKLTIFSITTLKEIFSKEIQ